MAGKGSKPRPLSVPRNKFEDNWERIFGNKGNNNSENDKQHKQQNKGN